MRAAVRERLCPRGLLRRWWPVLLTPAGLLLVWLARRDPWGTELLFSEWLYPLLARPVGALTSLLPFYLFEMGVIVLLDAALLWIGRGIFRLTRFLRGRGEPPGFGKTLWLLVNGLSILFFLFVITCGLNYYRPEFAAFSGLAVRDSSAEELAALCGELALEANALREGLPEDASGVMRLTEDFSGNAARARADFAKLEEDYNVLPAFAITPKPVLNSTLMSMAQITGEFTLLTFEANINTLAPDYSVPATMCHELAHTRGFMREDEANFIGYLACRKSDSPEFRYSGVMLALVHAENRLYATDRELFFQVDALLSDGVRRDFAANNAYWARFEGPVAEVSTAVNNTYLRANNQSDGVKSYGRMVDLLLADYRQRHGME